MMKEPLEQQLQGGVVLADNHFSKGKKIFQNVKFLTNFAKKGQSKKRKKESMEEGVDLTTLTKKQVQFNSAHRHARARIEIPFGFIKSKIEALNQPWSEDKEQLDNLVWIAAGIHNMTVA